MKSAGQDFHEPLQKICPVGKELERLSGDKEYLTAGLERFLNGLQCFYDGCSFRCR